MKKLIGLVLGMFLTIATFANGVVTYSDAATAEKSKTEGVFNFAFDTSFSIEDITKTATYYENYFTVTPVASEKGITVLNSPGTIDADYRGEIGVLLVNLSNDNFIIEDGERIAQLVIARHEVAEWKEVQTLSDTTRGAGGFGSTGVK